MGIPVPNKYKEQAGTTPGPVKTYRLTPEEVRERYGEPVQRANINGFTQRLIDIVRETGSIEGAAEVLGCTVKVLSAKLAIKNISVKQILKTNKEAVKMGPIEVYKPGKKGKNIPKDRSPEYRCEGCGKPFTPTADVPYCSLMCQTEAEKRDLLRELQLLEQSMIDDAGPEEVQQERAQAAPVGYAWQGKGAMSLKSALEYRDMLAQDIASLQIILDMCEDGPPVTDGIKGFLRFHRDNMVGALQAVNDALERVVVNL